MYNFRTSPQMINLWFVGMSFIPRLLSPVAFKSGTLYILFFWIPLLVILPEIVTDYQKKSVTLGKLPKLTKCLLLFSALIIFASLLFKDVIYAENAEGFIVHIRRSLYLLNPLICISWYPILKPNKKNDFFKLFFALLGLLGSSLVLTNVLLESSISKSLNNYTAQISSILFSFFHDNDIIVNNSFFGDHYFQMEVRWGCSSLPDIILSFNAIFVFYLCCKMKSKYKIMVVIFGSTLIAFLSNSIRIAILAYFAANEKNKGFEFWHDGLGSLAFTFIIITLSSFLYYFYWSKENPIENDIQQGN